MENEMKEEYIGTDAELELWRRCQQALRRKGVQNHLCDLVLFDMLLYNHTFENALKYATDWMVDQVYHNAKVVDKKKHAAQVFAALVEEAVNNAH